MPRHPTVALIADDLTGALDAAAPFVAQGLSAVVATSLQGLVAAMNCGADVVAVSIGSRELPQDQAILRATQAAKAMAGADWLFKKIDSRMKGHVAAELRAVADQRGAAQALLCPAIPAMGRVVQDGQLRGFGVDAPIDLSAAALASGLAVQIPPAQSDRDLDLALAQLTPQVVLCGARGLAAALARRIGRGAVAPVSPVLPQPVALAVGSRDPITLAQVTQLRAHVPGIGWTAAPVGLAPASEPAGNTILQATPGPGGVEGATVSARLAQGFVQHHIAGRRSLVLTGGETATAVLAVMNIHVLRLLGEVADGLPLSQPLDFPDPPLIVTKSGGFGPPDVLCALFSGDTQP